MPEVSEHNETGELPEQVVQWLGQPRYEQVADCMVAAANVHALCAAVEDANPAWWDQSVAAEVLGASCVPPAMLSSWTRPQLWHPDHQAGVMPLQLHYDLKAAFDYPTALVSGFESVFHAPVMIGDRLRSSQLLQKVSARKQTRLGPGRFWVIEVRYHNQADELVGTEQFDCLGYQSEAG